MRRLYPLLAALALASAAVSQDKVVPDSVAAATLRLCDADGDDAITLTELKSLFASYYRDVEACTTEEDWEKVAANYAYLINYEILCRADTDDDLRLTRTELSLAVAADQSDTLPPPSAKDCETLADVHLESEWPGTLATFDADKDGKLALAEVEAVLEADEDRATFHQMDTDSDKQLSREEFRAFLLKTLKVQYGIGG